MKELNPPTPVFYFISWIYHVDHFQEKELFGLFTEKFKAGLKHLRPTDNPSLDYYAKEMGPKEKLRRGISTMIRSEIREHLVPLKLWGFEQERVFLRKGKRLLNLDIGLVALEQVVLATRKPYSHRIYLHSGVYADLTLEFKGGRYQPLPWTYPDYQAEEKLNYFFDIRERLKKTITG